MTENASLSRRPPLHEQVAEYHFRDKILLRQGIMSVSDDVALEERYDAGLKLIVVHSGRVHSESTGGQQITIDSPAVFIAAGNDNYTLQNRFKAGLPLHYTLLQLSPDWLEQQQILLPAVFGCGNALSIRHIALDSRIAACAGQLFDSSVQDALKPLYYAGKAGELAALCLQQVITAPAVSHKPLSRREISGLQRAEAILRDEMENPPCLEQLGLRTGLSSRKLTQGFRQRYGQSVYGWLQELRLQTAWQMLTTQGEAISSVAYHVGYTPAHFSVVFRKRFGMAPGEVRKRHFYN
ncbi:helix-turn-helix transcriptional regulator [Morganella morganii]|uniref:helix-turn-helix transcriptional regulator n=1 Tax=Morganella morganii TaxID=582 RepID=UPI002368551F|nr:AraC family transcriptional regulator [Morganella morganii]